MAADDRDDDTKRTGDQKVLESCRMFPTESCSRRCKAEGGGCRCRREWEWPRQKKKKRGHENSEYVTLVTLLSNSSTQSTSPEPFLGMPLGCECRDPNLRKWVQGGQHCSATAPICPRCLSCPAFCLKDRHSTVLLVCSVALTWGQTESARKTGFFFFF